MAARRVLPRASSHAASPKKPARENAFVGECDWEANKLAKHDARKG